MALLSTREGHPHRTQLWRRRFRDTVLHSMALRWDGGWIKAVNRFHPSPPPDPPHSERDGQVSGSGGVSQNQGALLAEQRQEFFLLRQLAAAGCATASWGTQGPQAAGVDSGLRPARGLSFPWPGTQPRPPASGTWGSLTHWTTS